MYSDKEFSLRMSIVLTDSEVTHMSKCIKSVVYATSNIVVSEDEPNPFLEEDSELELAYKKDEDEGYARMLEDMAQSFSEREIDHQNYYVVINRITTQVSGDMHYDRAGYVYMLVRRSDKVPCMTYYARDNEKVEFNFDHDWLKWSPEAGNWFTYDRVHKRLIGKFIGDTADDK